MEKTVVLLKPDAVQRALIGKVISRLENKGFKIVALKFVQFERSVFEQHYAHHSGKPFFGGLVDFMTSAPIVCMILEGVDAAAQVRKIVGATNGRNADLGTIRGDFSLSTSANLVHASEDAAAAEVEMKRFFDEAEIYNWDRVLTPYLYAEEETK